MRGKSEIFTFTMIILIKFVFYDRFLTGPQHDVVFLS